MVWTYKDLIDAMDAFAQGQSTGVPDANKRAAIQTAYRDFPGLHDWRWLTTQGRIMLRAPQTTGTIASPREMATLTRRWPSTTCPVVRLTITSCTQPT
jgi:hypothetical protein